MHPSRHSKKQHRNTSLVLFGLLLCAGPLPSAVAEDKTGPEEVKTYEQLLARGDEAWEAEDWGDAREAYQQAYAIHADPTLLFNIASTFRREGKLEEALDNYEKYLKATGPRGEFRAQADETAKQLRKELAARREQQRREEAERRRAEQAVPAPALEPSTPADESRGLTVMQWGGIGSGVAGAAALTYGFMEHRRSEKLEKQIETASAGQPWTADLQKKYDAGKSADRNFIIFTVVGGSALIAGGTLFYFGGRDDKSTESEGISFVPVTDGESFGAVALGRF
jgi:tetratricopeptide (TPR) repeat protein